MSTILITDLQNIAGGLNIEGGYPYNNLIRDNPNKKVLWSNIVLILDRPIIDNVLFSDLDKKMNEESYLLLENTIDELNEHKMFAIYLMVIGYYLEYGKSLLGRMPHDDLHITIHIHQDVASINLINIIKKYLDDLCHHFNINITNIFLDYRTDDYTFVSSTHDYSGTDILLSLSQCAGLDADLLPGDIIIPKVFIPYDIENKSINIKNQYNIDNNILKILDYVLDSKYHMFSIDYVNKNYVSMNQTKNKNIVSKLHNEDFIVTPILQVNALWNPIDLTEMLNCI